MKTRRLPTDYGLVQLAGLLGWTRGEVERARDAGLIPVPQVGDRRWSADVAEVLAATADQLRSRIPPATAQTDRRAHGTHARYVIDRCRCGECRAANTAYERERARRIEPPYVSAAPVRKHVEWLSSQGVGLRTISATAGISHGALSKLMYGDRKRGKAPSKRVRPATAQAILAVAPADGAGGSRIPAGDTHAIVERLVARGWTRLAIARAIGQRTGGLQLGRRYVTRQNAIAIKSLLDQPVPPRRSRWGNQLDSVPEPTPGPNLRPSGEDDADRFIREMAELLEERIDQRAWHAEAACRGRPAWMWFPAVGDKRTTKAAKKVCDSCFVRDRCLAAHLDTPDGIYGGLTAAQRKALRKTRPAA